MSENTQPLDIALHRNLNRRQKLLNCVSTFSGEDQSKEQKLFIEPEGVYSDSAAFSPEKKIKLFKSLFRGREDVYPIRWEGKNGKSGYSPVCSNEWATGLCDKPRVKCPDCQNRKFAPVTDMVIRNHLTGKCIIGAYPLLVDESCYFLAVDFDKSSWKEDALTYMQTCEELGVDASLERSRSGNGGHVWIFFDHPIQAFLARKLGAFILSKSIDSRPEVGFGSYDRFFPSQDTMPKGGFGNLIALPLQHEPRKYGNSVFLDNDLKPHSDQRAYISSIKKMTIEDINQIVPKTSYGGELLGVRLISMNEDEESRPLALSANREQAEMLPIPEIPYKVKIELGSHLLIEKQNIPPLLQSRLIKLATFQNPEFYKAQAMRFSTYGKPRIICCADSDDSHIRLPRGCHAGTVELLKKHNAKMDISDTRTSGKVINASFKGTLREHQDEAVSEGMKHDFGVISAPTGFGKTVVAAKVIALRKVNTLILVHRCQLMDQWKEQLSLFLNVEIGLIGSGKMSRTSEVDIATIQSLYRKGKVKELVAEYGQVIVDECHQISAFSFEQVLKFSNAKFVVGLTATPIRKDGHHPIIFMQCGPIRYRFNKGRLKHLTDYEHIVIPRITNFRMPQNETDYTIHDIYTALLRDSDRNDLIFNDVVQALVDGRSPLLLTERKEHLLEFEQRLDKFAKNVIVLKGGMGVKKRRELAERLASIPDDEERVIISTGKYIGEGFDDARLDTLFLAMPISWKGTLQQYVGRLHRLHHDKKVLKVFDYADTSMPVLRRMHEKRLKGYKAIGYAVK